MANFSEVMAQRTDGQLLEIVTRLRNDYQPDAVLAAEHELQKRNLTENQLEEARLELKTNEKLTYAREDESLETIFKILFFIFFWGVIPWAIARTFKAKGYKLKYYEAWKFMFYGFITFIVIPIMLFVMADILS